MGQALQERKVAVRDIIRSGDPDAIARLEAALAACEALRRRLGAARRIIRAAPDDPLAALLRSGIAGEEARSLLRPDGSGDPDRLAGMLARNDGEIRRIRRRLAALGAAARRNSETGHGAFTSGHDVQGRSLWFRINGEPPARARDLLRQSGFRWSPSRDRWQRRRSREAGHAQNRLVRALGRMLDDIA